MRGTLVFAPCADPSYTPLGLASLASHLRAEAPDCELTPLDLNLELWNRAAEQDERLAACRDFLQGRAGDFHDAQLYRSHQAAWGATVKSLVALADGARAYLERDEVSLALHDALSFCAARIAATEPEWIGFSLMYPDQVLLSVALARHLAENVYGGASYPDRPALVLGGATAAALDPREVLAACPFLDGVFAGEGEQGLAGLLQGADPATLPGLSWRHADQIRINRKPDTLKASCVQLPMFEQMDPTTRYNPVPVLPVVFSRGCKWRKCRFCAHNLSYSGYRRQSAGRFADYLGALQERWGARHFYFADQYVDAEDLEELSLAILERGLDLSYHVMGRPTASYTPQRLELMSRAGCRWISWGVETGSARLLELCGKGTTPAEIAAVMTDASGAGILNLAMMIFGLPTSTDEDLRATLDWVSDLGGAVGSVTSSRFQLFDRTPFSVRPERYGLHVTGREVLFERLGQPVHSLRLYFKERASDGSLRPSRGALEVEEWKKWKRWSGLDDGGEGVCCEHTLLAAERRASGRATIC